MEIIGDCGKNIIQGEVKYEEKKNLDHLPDDSFHRCQTLVSIVESYLNFLVCLLDKFGSGSNHPKTKVNCIQ